MWPSSLGSRPTPWPEVPSPALHSPVCVSEDPRAVPGWKNSLEGKPVVKQIIVLGTQSRGDPRGAADTRAGSIRESCLLCGAEAPSLETESWLAAKSSGHGHLI